DGKIVGRIRIAHLPLSFINQPVEVSND
ncbi:MAG: hypothetical protein QOI28_1383, partial [Mycobacterium sp.]|nr:hypothetical protein [Mycobacterium sp.]MDT5189132.1 hypothetical protein [Mycobacterium sp.]